VVTRVHQDIGASLLEMVAILLTFTAALNAHHPVITGHSMIFDPSSRRLYVIGGERAGQSFDNM
jgi:hypothetical protein